MRDLEAVANLLSSNDIDAIEIHTGARYVLFCRIPSVVFSFRWVVLHPRLTIYSLLPLLLSISFHECTPCVIVHRINSRCFAGIWKPSIEWWETSPTRYYPSNSSL